MGKIDVKALLDEHKVVSKEFNRKKRTDAGIKRESYKAILPQKYRSYLMRSNAKGMDFELTIEEFNQILSLSCVYCGTLNNMTIDRVDSRYGYVKDNIQPCCYDCNMMKHFIDHQGFLRQVNKIYKHINLANHTEINNDY